MTDEVMKQKVAAAIRESGIAELYEQTIDATKAATQAYRRQIATRLRIRQLDAAIAKFKAMDGGTVH